MKTTVPIPARYYARLCDFMLQQGMPVSAWLERAGITPGQLHAPEATLPLVAVLLYLVLGVAWVFVGDALLAHWVTDPELLTRFQTWKGWGYVALTSGLAWWLLVAKPQSQPTVAQQAGTQMADAAPAPGPKIVIESAPAAPVVAAPSAQPEPAPAAPVASPAPAVAQVARRSALRIR